MPSCKVRTSSTCCRPFCHERILKRPFGAAGGNESRTFYTQMLLTGVDAAAVRQTQQEQAAEAGDDNEKQKSGVQQTLCLSLANCAAVLCTHTEPVQKTRMRCTCLRQNLTPPLISMWWMR